jgi:hypothetical protein
MVSDEESDFEELQRIAADLMAPADDLEEMSDLATKLEDSVSEFNLGADPDVIARVQAAIRDRASSDVDGLGMSEALNLLMPNLGAPSDVFRMAPATAAEIAATKQRLAEVPFTMDGANAPLQLLGAISQQMGMDFVISNQTDPALTAASCAATADFAMGNDLLTQNSLYLLGSDCPSHHSKGVTLHIDEDIESCKRNAEDLRAKLNELHGVKDPDSVVIMAVTSGSAKVTYALPGSASREVGIDDCKGVFRHKFLSHEYTESFRHLRIDERRFSSKWNRTKGAIVHLDQDVDSCRQNVEELRVKLNDLHGVSQPDSIVILAITPGSANITYALPANANREIGADECKGMFGDKYIGHQYIKPFRHLRIDETTFCPKWNRDFRIDKNVIHEWRGGFPYDAPAGFMRYGLMVSGRFDNGNDRWLEMWNLPGEWAVAYHGTKADLVNSITQSPLRPGPNNVYGRGVYCSPNVEEAARYAPSFTIDGRTYKYVFMCRVNVSSVHHCEERPCPEAGNPTFTLHITSRRDYWFVNAENQNYQNIRTYGLLVREE